MATGRDVDLLLWAVAEARRLRIEEPVSKEVGFRPFVRDLAPESQFTTEWEQSVPRAASF